jgi:hypothetical protein
VVYEAQAITCANGEELFGGVPLAPGSKDHAAHTAAGTPSLLPLPLPSCPLLLAGLLMAGRGWSNLLPATSQKPQEAARDAVIKVANPTCITCLSSSRLL